MSKIVHEMKLQPEPFEAIKAGKKIIESRLYDEKRRLIKIGDTIEFKKNPNLTESIKTEVVGLLNYPNFNVLFSDFPSEVFGFSTKEELLKQIQQFYPPEEQQKHGVLGIKIKLLQ
jgi:ASC-1-like (ASCH) protein